MIAGIAIALAALVVFVWLAWRRDHGDDWRAEPSEPLPTGGSDVSVLRFAIDASATKFVTGELERIGKLRGGELLREAGVLLRRVREQWLYGGAINEPLRSPAEAKQVFAQHVARAKEHAGGTQGVLVVTLVVAAQNELASVSQANVAEELRRALEAAAYRTDLVDVEVVSGTCATEELQARYPELIEIGASLAGKISCTHCGGPFPAELVTCPHCGAPAPGRERAA